MNYRSKSVKEEFADDGLLDVPAVGLDLLDAEIDDDQCECFTLQLESERLILEHRESGRKLARSFLRKWHVCIPLDEINSVVDLSLCQAAGRYESDRGATFMTFLFPHLRGNLVRVIKRMMEPSFLLLSPSSEGWSDPTEYRFSRNQDPYSIDPERMSIGKCEDDIPEDILLRKEQVGLCRKAWGQLDPLEREILLRLYSDEHALIDIAETLGYSRCHISRVKKRALSKLKKAYQQLQHADELAQKTANGRTERPTQVERPVARQRGRKRRVLPENVSKMQMASKFATG